jgi:hypothetical protein
LVPLLLGAKAAQKIKSDPICNKIFRRQTEAMMKDYEAKIKKHLSDYAKRIVDGMIETEAIM